MGQEEKIPDRDRLDALIKSQFSASFMSDAKWVRLLRVLAEVGDAVNVCYVKLVWDDQVRVLRMDSSIQYGYDFHDSTMEAMIPGLPRGWYSYKEMEWLEFPTEGQDTDAIALQIETAGQFQLEKRLDGLRLYAYK